MSFPKDFLWGTATSSYQIEGAALEDGRGECIWTRFSRTSGNIDNNDNGDVACDHYHRYPEDIQLMKDLGINAYRFSTAWSRVIPAGTGATNPQGLDFYDKLVDEILAADIQPFITLYHWDLPQALQDRGGWENPDSVQWFADYAELLAHRLGDRVKHWITHNEPWVVAFAGNYEGRHAPGKQDLSIALKVAHHLMLSHGAAMPVIREHVADVEAGITLNVTWCQPHTDTPEDKAACTRQEGFMNRWFGDPLFKGEYPADMLEVFSDYLGDIDTSAISAAKVHNDFVGINYYSRATIGHSDEDAPLHLAHHKVPGAEYTDMGWEVYADGLRDFLLWCQETYQPEKVYITENGAAFPDAAPDAETNIVEDPRRVAYLEGHFAAAEQAIERGVPLKGYFVWSFMDNFEWAWGYRKRFGIHYVDYETLQRQPKRSALFYREFIASQRA